MKRFIQGESRTQSTLLPAVLDDYIADTNPVRVVECFPRLTNEAPARVFHQGPQPQALHR